MEEFIIVEALRTERVGMISVKVRSFPRGEVDRKVQVAAGSTPLDLLKSLDLRPDNWLVARGEKVIPDDEPLEDGDDIRLISVVSGG